MRQRFVIFVVVEVVGTQNSRELKVGPHVALVQELEQGFKLEQVFIFMPLQVDNPAQNESIQIQRFWKYLPFLKEFTIVKFAVSDVFIAVA